MSFSSVPITLMLHLNFTSFGVSWLCLSWSRDGLLLTAACYYLQHYMLNNEINEQLVTASSVEEGDTVLEIGPGTGSLTNALINVGATVLAIEKVTYASLLTLVLLA